MIKKEDLLEAISECQGIKNPNASTCLKLAAYYVILDHIEEDGKENKTVEIMQSYSYSKEPGYSSDTEFGKYIEELDKNKLMKIMDELMSTLQVVNPRLYMSVIRKLEDNI